MALQNNHRKGARLYRQITGSIKYYKYLISTVTFNGVAVELPRHSVIHHLWLINIPGYESLIMGL